MSVCLPVKMCFRDRQFTYLVWIMCRVSSFTFDAPNVSLFLDAFSKEALISTRSLRSEFADTLVASRPDDAFIDLIASSNLGSNYIFNSSQNCILYPIFDRIYDIAHLSVNHFIETPFQSFHTHCISIHN